MCQDPRLRLPSPSNDDEWIGSLRFCLPELDRANPQAPETIHEGDGTSEWLYIIWLPERCADATHEHCCIQRTMNKIRLDGAISLTPGKVTTLMPPPQYNVMTSSK